MIEIVLFQPEIPQNTGNIGRTCVGFNVKLNIIKPMGFRLNNKSFRRAGLDYWKYLNYELFDSFDIFYHQQVFNTNNKLILLTKFSNESIVDYKFNLNNILIFGMETKGFPKEYIEKYNINTLSFPMPGNIRSYNLANTCAMSIYSAYSQLKW